MAQTGTYALILQLLLVLSVSGSNADELAAPVVSVERTTAGVEIHASSMLALRPCEAYAMLTQYDRLPEFIPDMLASSYQRLSAHRVRVRQTGQIQLFLFHLRTESLLEMEETPNRRIVFEQIEGDMAKSYSGEWRFAAAKGGTLLDYRANMSFPAFVPRDLARSVLRIAVTKQFVAVAREAEKRRRQGGGSCAGE